jgi:hypothetical protein
MEEDGWFQRTTSDISEGIIFRFLKRESDEKIRVEWLSDAIQRATGIFLPVRIIAMETAHRERGTQYCVLPENVLKRLQNACVTKIQAWAKNKESKNDPRVIDILVSWKKWGAVEDVSAWISEFISTKNGVLSFLHYFLNFPETHKEHFDTEHLMNAMNFIEWFIPLDQISAKISEFELKNNDLVIDRFQKGVALKKEHRPNLP